nr:ribonuclease H-like domain-containing protein [Tanacetum cinerariifolium]
MIIIMVNILKPLTLHHQFLLQHNKSLILFHPSIFHPKKREYDIWAMKMKHYLSHTDYPIWQVIHNGNGPVLVTIDTNEIIKVLPLKTAEEVMARERERKARTTLLMALLEDHLEKFHKIADAKEMWEAIKSRFGGNDEFKKMQKYLTKPGLDTLNFDDLYNTLRVLERDVKGTTASSSNTQNVAFVSGDNTSSTNDVSTTYSVSSPIVSKSHKEGSSSYTNEVIHSFFANKSNSPQLDYDYLKQINDDDMEEMDLKWQVAMISIRIKKFHKRIGRTLQFDTKDPVELKGRKTVEEEILGTMKTKLETMVEGLHIRMIQKLWLPLMKRILTGLDMLRKILRTMLRWLTLSAIQVLTIRFIKIDLDDKTDVLAYHKKLLAEALIEKEDLKTKFKNWQNSSKNLSRLLNTQMSTNDKFGLGYGDYRYGSILSYENEVLQSVFMNNASDLEDTSINDRYADGMHAVPPPMTKNYMPSRLNVEIDYSKFTYGPKQTSVDESDSKPSEYASCESDSSVETITSMPEPVENAP